MRDECRAARARAPAARPGCRTGAGRCRRRGRERAARLWLYLSSQVRSLRPSLTPVPTRPAPA
jgi:hypothetical protein